MFLKLFLAFTIIPVIEIYILIQIGSVFGPLTSVALVIFTGFLGAYLARLQGMQTILRIQENLKEGRMPSSDLLDALLIGVAGLVLLTPGFLTDLFGFILLIPATRIGVKAWLKGKFKNRYDPAHPEDIIIEQ